ncbi:hypothetical protein BAUCODRAFT_59325, partial [Baudoinia panamericana UAMH 10762]
MSPHAVSVNGHRASHQYTNGSTHENANDGQQVLPSLLKSAKDVDDVHDLICVGFGPASLAIAVALHDALEEGSPELRTSRPRVKFLERQERFAWHAGMLLPGAKMQISFIKDLASLRNPRSRFTFLNYLHEKGRLVKFSNLGTFLPQRIEYEDYMRWCASHFEDVVDYGQAVQSIRPGSTNPVTGQVDTFDVVVKSLRFGEVYTLRTKHVVIAVGGKPNMPECFPPQHPRIIHSSQYATNIDSICPRDQQPRSIAVIGAGQSAAEVFDNLSTKFPNAKSYLVIRGAALRPSDDSPFVNEIFDPSRVDDIYGQAAKIRAEQLERDRGTNYGVVRLELLDHIYSRLYSYDVQYGHDDVKWPQRILNHRTLTAVEDSDLDGRPVLTLRIRNDSGEYCKFKQPKEESLTVDLVIVASGYRRDAHEYMLKDLRHLMPKGGDAYETWNVRRDYSVQFGKHTVQDDAGIWLQGCNEQTHGLADSLLSILAVRGGEMVHSIFG